MTAAQLLEVEGLGVSLARRGAPPHPILDDISLSLAAGETLGIVGESGSGKSTLALVLMGLLPPAMRIAGRARFENRDIVAMTEPELCRIRGARIGLVSQEPLTALNPIMTAGSQIAESVRLHRRCGPAEALTEALRLLDRVRMPDAARKAAAYPHELSGGQRQRVALAIALAPDPALLIADEPTTALDVTVQAEILDLLGEIVRERGMSLILVSHDLGVVARICGRVLVLYAGARFEAGPTREVLRDPRNPYTRGLIASQPRLRGDAATRLPSIAGTVPRSTAAPSACRFAPRCPDRVAACEGSEPAWTSIGPARGLRCIQATRTGVDAGYLPPRPWS